MAIDDEGARTRSPEVSDVEAREHPVTERSRGRATTGIVLGSLLGVLLLAGIVYYIAGHRAGTEVATGPSPKQVPENSAVTTQPRPPEGAEKPTASTAPPPAASAAPTANLPPATPAREGAANNAPAASGGRPGESAEAPAVPQRSMRDRPAALPDQPGAGPANEAVLKVQRGPANIRSAPGKSGRLIGTVAKGAQLKEISRSGSWVEVDTDSGRGWISAALLAPLSAARR
jgi:hypothetical protein